MSRIELTILSLGVLAFGLALLSFGLFASGRIVTGTGDAVAALACVCLAMGLTRDR